MDINRRNNNTPGRTRLQPQVLRKPGKSITAILNYFSGGIDMKQNRKNLGRLLLVFTILVALPVEALAAQFMKTTTDLRLRSGASSATSILDVIPKGTQIEIIDTTGVWANTRYNAKTGFASLLYMAPTPATIMTMVTIDLRLRQGPSTAYSILAVIPKNTPIPVLDRSGGWIKTLWAGKVGWVGGTYTKLLSLLPQLETSVDLNFRAGPGTGYAILQKIPRGTRLLVLAQSLSGSWVKTWYNAKVGWVSKSYLVLPATSFRPASPPSFILDYSNQKISWSQLYPEDYHYGYPELGGRYRYTDGKVHLTLDLGYENGLTGGFLDILKAKNVKVKFYVTGYYLRTQPGLVRRILSEGHLIGNHSDKHLDTVDLMASSLQKVYDDLRVWEEEYRTVTGTYPRKWFYRPPSGIFSERTFGLLYWMGYKSELWQVALADWDPEDQLSEAYTLDRLMTDTKQGSLVLLHGVSSTNQKILGRYIDGIRAKGWNFADPWLD